MAVRTFRIVRYGVGVRYSGVSVKRGSTVPGMKPLRSYVVTTKGAVKNNFQEKKLPYFFDLTTRLLAACFCGLLFEGGVYFIGKPVDINHG